MSRRKVVTFGSVIAAGIILAGLRFDGAIAFGSFEPPQPPYVEVKTKHLTDEDIAYGEQQVGNMLHDRPQMATCVKKGDWLWGWAVRQFAGEALGCRIRWNKEKPSGDSRGDNSYPNADQKIGYIRVSNVTAKGLPLNGEEQWSVAVFELHNIRNARGFEQTDRDAYDGKILTAKEYVRRITQLEFKADLQRRRFYSHQWVPHAKKNVLSTTGYIWGVYSPDTYEKWIVQIPETSSYIRSYSDYFEKSVLSYRKRKQEYDKELAAYVRKKELCDNQLNAYDKRMAEYIEKQKQSGRQSGDFEKVQTDYSANTSKALSQKLALAETQDRLREQEIALRMNRPSTVIYGSELLAANHGVVEIEKAREIEAIEKAAQSFYLERKYKQAESLYKQAADIRARDVGRDHPDYATAINNLALIYYKLNRYEEAERLYKQALSIREKAFGEDSGAVKETLQHMVALYHAQGKTSEGTALQSRIKEIEELEASDDEGVSTDKVEWMKAPVN